MKTRIALVVMLMLVYLSTAAQQADNTAIKQKIAPFLSWVGVWKGQGTMMTPSGETKTSSIDERIEARLDNTLILIQGLGKTSNPETVVHEAMGVLTYDAASGQYKFKSWLRDGRSTDAWFNVVAENNYQWGFETPMGKIRYSILIDPAKKTWVETGEFSRDSANWVKFFQMNLSKVE